VIGLIGVTTTQLEAFYWGIAFDVTDRTRGCGWRPSEGGEYDTSHQALGSGERTCLFS